MPIATAACDASTSSSRQSSSSNFPYPRLDSTIAPIDSLPASIGTASMDSRMSSVPGITTEKSISRASGVSRLCCVAATHPVMPSPIWEERLSIVSSPYSVEMSPLNATGSSVCPSGCSTYTRQLW